MSDEEVQACVRRAEDDYETMKDRCHDLYERLENSGPIVYIKKETLNKWVAKYFKQELISIDDLIGCIEDLDGELEHLKEEFEDYKENVSENYKPIY